MTQAVTLTGYQLLALVFVCVIMGFFAGAAMGHDD